MNKLNKSREVASFYYSFNGPQEIEFETFIKSNRRLLKKIAAYQFEDWRLAIELAESLDEVLCFLTINFGRQYPAMTATSTNARLHLLQVWENKWGQLPTKWRIGFVRHSSFSTIQGIDLEILCYLFTQHRKFSSVINHLRSLRIRTDENELIEDFLIVGELMESFTLSAIESDIHFDDDTMIELSADTEIPLDWNIDDLDSDDILQVWNAEESY